MPTTDACGWCGEPFINGERHSPGWDGEPSHVRCAVIARREQAIERDKMRGGVGIVESVFQPYEREPFIDWPNGQGTYD